MTSSIYKYTDISWPRVAGGIISSAPRNPIIFLWSMIPQWQVKRGNISLPCLCRVLLRKKSTAARGPRVYCVFGSLWVSVHVHWAHTHTHVHAAIHPCCLVACNCWTLETAPYSQTVTTGGKADMHTYSKLDKRSFVLVWCCAATLGMLPLWGLAFVWSLQVYRWTVRLPHSGLVVCVWDGCCFPPLLNESHTIPSVLQYCISRADHFPLEIGLPLLDLSISCFCGARYFDAL